METTEIQFDIESALKQEADKVCERLGLDLGAYLRLCVIWLATDGKIQSFMKDNCNSDTIMDILARTGRTAAENGTADMTLDEINAEIAEARKERDARKEQEGKENT